MYVAWRSVGRQIQSVLKLIATRHPPRPQVPLRLQLVHRVRSNAMVARKERRAKAAQAAGKRATWITWTPVVPFSAVSEVLSLGLQIRRTSEIQNLVPVAVSHITGRWSGTSWGAIPMAPAN